MLQFITQPSKVTLTSGNMALPLWYFLKLALWAQFLRDLLQTWWESSHRYCQSLTAKSSLISYTQLKWCMFAVLKKMLNLETLFSTLLTNAAQTALI